MESRASSMAQLSSWTEVMKSSKDRKYETPKEFHPEEDYDEEFEDYEEEFEDEVPDIAPSKLQPIVITSQSDRATIQYAIRDQEKKPSEAKAHNDFKSSLSKSIADPRTVRIQRIFSSGVLNMQFEKYTLYNSLPTPAYDYYIQSLRLENSNIRQTGVPNDIELCDTEINTEDVFSSNKETQHCYDDDLPFYRLIEKMKERKINKSPSSAIMDELQNENCLHDNDDTEDSTPLMVNKLSNFLEKSVGVLENLLNAQIRPVGESSIENSSIRSAGREREYVFEQKNDWISVGKDYKYGQNELLRTRTNENIIFSTLQPHIFIVSHPAPVGKDAELDLRPLKALFSIWDSNKVECPSFLLEANGTPSVCCFSATQSFIVVVGTAEGNIHLWDLRESSYFHRDKDSEDLKISKGIRKPTFSTHLSAIQLNSGVVTNNNFDEEYLYNHSGRILQIESLDSLNTFDDANIFTFAASQFITLDEFGTIIFWVSSESFSASHVEENLKQSPWGKVVLLPTKCISLSPSIYELKYSSNDRQPVVKKQSATNNLRGEFVTSSYCTLGTIANDFSSFLLSDAFGQLHRISRTGQISFPSIYSRRGNSEEINCQLKKNSSQIIHSFEKVTVIAARLPINFQQKPIVDIAELVLVGRENGNLDLFQLEDEVPIHTWVLSAMSGFCNSKIAQNQISEIVCVKWLQYTKAAFIVLDSSGVFFYFDLLHDFYHPIFVESIGYRSIDKLTKLNIDVSRLNSTLDTYRIVVVDNSTKSDSTSGNILLRSLNSSLFSSKKYSDEDEQNLQQKLLSTVTNTVKSTSIVLPD